MWGGNQNQEVSESKPMTFLGKHKKIAENLTYTKNVIGLLSETSWFWFPPHIYLLLLILLPLLYHRAQFWLSFPFCIRIRWKGILAGSWFNKGLDRSILSWSYLSQTPCPHLILDQINPSQLQCCSQIGPLWFTVNIHGLGIFLFLRLSYRVFLSSSTQRLIFLTS